MWYPNGKPPVPLLSTSFRGWVLIRDPLGEFEPLAALCTDLQAWPTPIVEWLVLRWQVDVTFHEARGKRQWSDLAIARTTPAWLGFFSWITLLAHALVAQQTASVRSSACYTKSLPTFANGIAWALSLLWQSTFCMSPNDPDILKVSRSFFSRLTDTLCYAA